MSTYLAEVRVSRRVKVNDDRVIHLQETGAGGAACFLLHGFGEGGYIWEDMAASLSMRYRVFTVDLCGHGDSDWLVSAAYSVGQYVTDIQTIVDTLGIQRMVVIGHSLGAAIGVQLAAQTPNLVYKMVVADFGLNMSEPTAAHTVEQFLNQHRRYGSIEEYVARMTLDRPLASPAVIERLARGALRRLDTGEFELKADPRIAVGQEDCGEPTLDGQLRSIRCPVLVIRGIASAAFSQSAAVATCATLRAGRLAIVPNAGHAVVTDNPSAFEAAVHEFLF